MNDIERLARVLFVVKQTTVTKTLKDMVNISDKGNATITKDNVQTLSEFTKLKFSELPDKVKQQEIELAELTLKKLVNYG